ncbi:hypothetical protein ACWDSL_07850 [Streptomyces sp. NPDC000941]
MRQLGTDPDSRIAVAAGILTVLAAAAETRAAMPAAAWTVAPLTRSATTRLRSRPR